MRLGLNLTAPSYYQSDLKFGDLMLASSPFQGIAPATPAVPMAGKWPLSLAPGQHGWYIPASDNYAKAGVHTLTAQGAGTIQFRNADVPAPQSILTFTGRGETYTFPLTGTRKTLLQVDAVDPQNPLHDIQLLAPGAVPGQLWHPDYLDGLRGFSMFRFMDWMGTNGSKVANWADAPTAPGHRIADMIDLCNRLHCNPWFCIPHLAATATGVTDYPAQLGALIAASLDPDLTCFLEYSNEVWNWGAGGAQQTGYVSTIANATDPGPGRGLRYAYARLAGAAFSAAAGQIDPVKGPRVVRVLSGQCAVSWTITQSLAAAQAGGWPFDAIAFAPYCGSLASTEALEALWTAKDPADAVALLVQGMRDWWTVNGANWLPAWQAAAEAAGVELLCYEMGPGLSAQDKVPALAPVLQAAWDDPRAADWQRDYLETLGSACAGACYYKHCEPTIWGALQTLGDTASRRWAGLRAFAKRWNA